MVENQSAPLEQNQSVGLNDAEDGETKNPDTVSYESFSKQYKSTQKWKSEARTLADENEKLKGLVQEIKEKELAEKENWKTLYETRSQELEDLKNQLNGERENRSKMIKYSALLKALPGDVKENYWSLLPIDQIELSDEGVDEMSVKRAAEFVMKQTPEIVLMAKKGPELPSKSPTSAVPGGSNRDELLKRFVSLHK